MGIRNDGTGIYQHVSGATDRIPPYGKRSGDHLWTVLTMYRVADPAAAMSGHTQYLDSENLLMTTPIGCYYCEQTYTKTLADRRCPGKPKD